MAFEQIQDIEVLHTLLKMQQKESARLKRELTEAHAKLQSQDVKEAEQLALRLHELEMQHAAALKGLFGPKSERRPQADSAPSKKSPQRGHGPKEQPKLPVEEVFHTLSESEAQCELCAEPMKAWEGQFEASTEIDFVEPKLTIKKHLRQKYRCTCGGCVKTAPGPLCADQLGRLSMARAKNGEAIGLSGKTRAAKNKLQQFIDEGEKKRKLDEWRRGRAVQGYIQGKKVIALSEELGVTRGSVNR